MEVSLEWGATRICTRAYLFLVYINYLEEGVTGNILKFADDAKLFRKLRKLEIDKLHDDIDKCVRWSKKIADVIQFWEM